MDSFLLNELHPAMVTDSKLSSHPIVQTVSNPDEITAIFDVISYQKVYYEQFCIHTNQLFFLNYKMTTNIVIRERLS